MTKKELKKLTDRQLEKLAKQFEDKAWQVRVEIINRDKKRYPQTKVH